MLVFRGQRTIDQGRYRDSDPRHIGIFAFLKFALVIYIAIAKRFMTKMVIA